MALICSKCEAEHDLDAPCPVSLKLRRRTFIFGTLGLVAAAAVPLKLVEAQTIVEAVRRGPYVGLGRGRGLSLPSNLPSNPLSFRDPILGFDWVTTTIDGTIQSRGEGDREVCNAKGEILGMLPAGKSNMKDVVWLRSANIVLKPPQSQPQPSPLDQIRPQRRRASHHV